MILKGYSKASLIHLVTMNAEKRVYGLERFLAAQNQKYSGFDAAMAEIRAGKKTGHWIWYIFPQLKGLGKSERSKFYGLNGREEAKDFVKNELLYTRLKEATKALIDQPLPIIKVMGNDTIKVRSCMLLFYSITEEKLFKDAIDKLF